MIEGAAPNALVVYWGAGPAGIRYALDVARATEVPTLACLHDTARQASQGVADHVCIDLVPGPAGRISPLALAFNLPSRLLRLRRLIVAYRITCAIIPMNFAQAAAVAWACRMMGLPLLYVAHDAEPHPGDFAPNLQRLTQRALIASATRVIAPSRHVAERLQARYPVLARAGVAVAALEAAARPPDRLPRQRAPGRLRFLMLGRLIAYKGFPLLRDALDRLQAREDWSLTIAGDGPERPLVERLFGSMAQVDLSHLGFVPEEAVATLIEHHDVVICPYAEASQSGLIPQAAAAGLPALVTPVGGLPEQVHYGRTGWVAAEATGDALAHAIADAIADEAGYARRSIAALAALAEVDRPWPGLVRSAAAER